jgi:AcrR family transcriptional regulator
MPAPTRTTRSEWIDAGLSALAQGGPEAVRVDTLAQAIGVSRGGFYHQFDDRKALLDALLDTWEARSADEVLERVEREGGDARSKVTRAGLLTFSEELLPVDLAIRDWARRDPEVAERLCRVDNRRMEYLRTLISDLHADAEDVEAVALMAFSLLIGSHFIAADHGPRGRAAVLRRAAARLLS